MAHIEQLLGELESSRITPAVLGALDYVVPGEWTDVTSLDQAIEVYLGVTEPAEAARIRAHAMVLWESQPHYQRAVKVFQAADAVDKVAAAAVLANEVGQAIRFLGILDRFTPKAETTQSIDAALKLTAEIVAFALLRGIPVTSLTEAKAFPATLATYARADLMRLAAWMSLDGLLPLGPEFVQKIRDVVAGVDTSILTSNPLFQQLRELLPGSSAEEQKGFILSSLDSASTYISEFVEARGLTQEDLAGKVGGVVNAAETGMDLLAATIDATTNYFEHTGVQSVARVLVHDAQESLEADVPPPPPQGELAPASTEASAAEASSPWFKTAAAVAAGAGAVAVGAYAFRARADSDDEEEGGLEAAFDEEDLAPEDEDLSDLEGLDENALAAREAALQMRARRLRRREAAVDEQMGVMKERRRLQRARRRRGGGGPGPRRRRRGRRRGGRGR